ncbi:MAG: tRNA 2-thiouridine(34) synthase MnmA [Treponema sp.]|jgi:tRNA-specific 2-thiouridylase|nr:tRNA 2-thiouridine(34) synthase MnmA [Treponema sp.]
MNGAGKKAVVAMSGGVDSSVAAALTLEQGYQCIGVTLKLYTGEDIAASRRGCGSETTSHTPRGCCSLADVNDARNVAFRLNMPHYVLNFTGEFREQVIRRFIETYEAGATPNPCIDCNRYIKFDHLLLRAKQLDFDYLVTGHYARIEQDLSTGRFLLKKARDEKKDQSYVLYCLTQDQLRQTHFPLGDLTKAQVREIAGTKNFGNAEKGDSQDICFVPDRDYGAFIEAYTGKTWPPGDIIGTDGTILGQHRGIIRYTIGQRRGLGVAANEPLYVAAKSVRDNTVTLGPEASLCARSLSVSGLNLIACPRLEKPLRVKVKTRYLQAEQDALVEQTGEDTARIAFDEPQRALTPGQAAVFYDGDYVVGGGTIAAVW